MKVMSVSCTYTVDIWISLKFFPVATTNGNNENKNSLASGRILNFLNSFLQEALLLAPAIILIIIPYDMIEWK
jgi:hypothetical protein